MTEKVNEGQDILDISLQYFGDIENLFDIFTDNPSLTLNSNLTFAQDVEINNADKGIIANKEFFRKNNFVVINLAENEIATLGDYNIDFNNDYDI